MVVEEQLDDSTAVHVRLDSGSPGSGTGADTATMSGPDAADDLELGHLTQEGLVSSDDPD